jgi:hypothetical protein
LHFSEAWPCSNSSEMQFLLIAFINKVGES